jgi:hypothetical protein
MRQESVTLQEFGNLEVDRKLPSTLQTQHQLYACSFVGSVAKRKIQEELEKSLYVHAKENTWALLSSLKSSQN